MEQPKHRYETTAHYQALFLNNKESLHKDLSAGLSVNQIARKWKLCRPEQLRVFLKKHPEMQAIADENGKRRQFSTRGKVTL